MKTDMSKKYVNDLVGSSTSAWQAEQGEQADKARIGEHLSSFFEAVGRIPSLQFQPVSAMTLDDMANEALGLSYWSDVLGDRYAERTQARIDELHTEMERREADTGDQAGEVSAKQGYSIAPEDVQAYLDTLKPGDNIGVSYNSAECLVARAIRHKYQRPDLWVCVETETITIDGGPSAVEEFLTPPDIRTIINTFDDVTSSCRPITKQEWLEACAEVEK